MKLSLETIIKKFLSFIDKLTDKITDLIISKPKKNENLQSAITFGASLLAAKEITVGAISATESLSSAGATSYAVQSASTIAAAGTEFLAAPTSATETIVESESAPLIVAGATVLTFSLVGGKIASRVVGHVYDYLGLNSENLEDNPDENKNLIKPKRA